MSRIYWFLAVLFAFFVVCAAKKKSLAEGTKEIMPTYYSYGRIEINPNFSQFAYYGCPNVDRLNITVCNAGETIYFGFGDVFDFSQIKKYDVQFTLRDPSGNAVIGPAMLPGAGQTGHINSYYQAISGPGLISVGGYNALTYSTLTQGDYYIEFFFEDPSELDRREIQYFDITVASAANQKLPGRLWSQAWQLTVTASPSPYYYDYPFNGTMFVYSDDGIVTSIDFNGMRPFVFKVCANETGCFNTGNLVYDRKSIQGYYNYPQYKVFLNDPDSNCFPTGVIGTITEPSYFSGDSPTNYCFNVYVNKPGIVDVVVELNGIPGYQPGTKDRLLVYEVASGQNCIPFNGKDGLGNLITGCTYISVEISYFNGMTHLPLTDVEYNQNGFKVKIIRPSVIPSNPPLFWDDSNIPGYSNPPADGCTDLTGCHDFTNFYGDSCTVNTWWFSASEIMDYFTFNLSNLTVDANGLTPSWEGNDIWVCSLEEQVQLNGKVTFAGGGIWSGGGGVFTPSATSLNAIYTSTDQEINNGSVQLILTSTDNLGCEPLADDMTIHFVEAETLNAGPDQSVCLNTDVVILNGSTSDPINTRWEGGEGVFAPGRNTLNPTYTPSSGEMQTGYVDFELTWEGVICAPAIDEVKISLLYFDAIIETKPASCYGKSDGSITLLSDYTPQLEYQWTNGATTNSLVGVVSSDYCSTVTINGLCPQTYCDLVSQPDSLFYSVISKNVSCNNIELGSIEVIPGGGTPDYAFQWAEGNTKEFRGGLESGLYLFTITDATGCTTTGQQWISKRGNPSASFYPDFMTNCTTIPVQFNGSTDSASYSCIWNFGDGTTDIGLNPLHIYSSPGEYSVSLSVHTAEGCDSTFTSSQLLRVNPSPEADFITIPEITDIFHPKIEIVDASSGDVIFRQWDFNNQMSSNQENPVIFYEKPGSYEIVLRVENEYDCYAVETHTVIVQDIPTIYVPDAFTPNGDGENDRFIAKGHAIDPSSFDMEIYDRWGEPIFHSSEISEGWNGIIKGNNPAPIGVYTWRISCTSTDGKKFSDAGWVTLIR